MESKRLQAAKKFVDHYAENDNEVLHSLLADGLVYTFSPSRSLARMDLTFLADGAGLLMYDT